jgi:hypothetical protein
MGHGVHVGGEVGATGNIRARGAFAARIRVCPMSWADGPLGRALWWGLRLGLGALRVRSTVAAADLGGAAAAQRAGTPGPPRGLASRVVRCAAHEMCSTSHDGMCEPSALATAVQFGRTSTGAYRAAPRGSASSAENARGYGDAHDRVRSPASQAAACWLCIASSFHYAVQLNKEHESWLPLSPVYCMRVWNCTGSSPTVSHSKIRAATALRCWPQ